MKKILLITALMLSTTFAFTFSGNLTDACSGNISDAVLTLTNATGSETATTNESSYFEFADVNAGTYHITVAQSDNSWHAKTIVISENTVENIILTRTYCPSFSPSNDFGSVIYDIAGGFMNGLTEIALSGAIIYVVVAALFIGLVTILFFKFSKK